MATHVRSNPLCMQSIPRVVHIVWVSRDGTDADPPAKFKRYEQGWRTHCGHYETRLWRTSDVERLWRENSELVEFRSLYEHALLIEKCDLTRYAIMHIHGGVYRDMNVECYRDIDPMLAGREIALSREPPEHLSHVFSGELVGNQFMASRPGHPFWLHTLRYMRDHYRPTVSLRADDMSNVMANTGPLGLGRALNELPPSVTREYFVSHCKVMPFVLTYALRAKVPSLQCAFQRDDDFFMAKHWADTSCWGVNECSSDWSWVVSRIKERRRALVAAVVSLLVAAAVVSLARRQK